MVDRKRPDDQTMRVYDEALSIPAPVFSRLIALTDSTKPQRVRQTFVAETDLVALATALMVPLCIIDDRRAFECSCYRHDQDPGDEDRFPITP